MTTVLARRSKELRAEGEALIKQADKLLAESWSERMWADGELTIPHPILRMNQNQSKAGVRASRCRKAMNSVSRASEQWRMS